MSEAFDTVKFRDFCAGKPKGERYRFMSVQDCPVTQFGRHIGVIAGRKTVYDHPGLNDLHNRAGDALCESPATWGALASRLSALIREGGNV